MASANDARFANAAEMAAALDRVRYLADTGVATDGHRRYVGVPGNTDDLMSIAASPLYARLRR